MYAVFGIALFFETDDEVLFTLFLGGSIMCLWSRSFICVFFGREKM